MMIGEDTFESVNITSVIIRGQSMAGCIKNYDW